MSLKTFERDVPSLKRSSGIPVRAKRCFKVQQAQQPFGFVRTNPCFSLSCNLLEHRLPARRAHEAQAGELRLSLLRGFETADSEWKLNEKGPWADGPFYHRAFSTNALIVIKNTVQDVALEQLRLI